MINTLFGRLAILASLILSNALLAQTFRFEYVGAPVVDVRVTQEGRLVGISGRNGEVEVEACANTLRVCDLTFTHPNYQTLRSIIEPGEQLEDIETVILDPINKNIEELLVTTKPNALSHFNALNTANSTIVLTDMAATPTTVLDALTDIPGISENGQGGLFQVYSIRGLSRQRVLTYIGSIPLKAERRAGVASSFLHPLLFSSVEAQRGPASTVYLSGSLGGVVQLEPRQFEDNHLYLDYDANGQRNQQLFGTRLSNWSLGLARQSSNRSEDVAGNELNDAYDQYSLSTIAEWKVGDLNLLWTNLISRGDDIGRSSTRFPGRIITVPHEEHWLSQLQLGDDNWELSVFAHPNQVETLTVRPENRTNFVKNESIDLGTSFKQTWDTEKFSGTWGADYFMRDDVNASDLGTSLTDATQSLSRSLNGASEKEFGLYATASTYVGQGKWQLGARIIDHRAKNTGVVSLDDNAATAFVGVSLPVSNRVYLTANLGTGVRFPTLSERFFTGTTGRGEVIGNPDLEKETSASIDAGVKYQTSNVQLNVNAYQQKISDYIERIEVEPELLSFRNVNDGTITGLDLETKYQLNPNWQTSVSLSILDGEDDAGNPLIDIPANRLNLTSDYQWRNWSFTNEFEFRKSKTSVANNEKPTDSVLITNLGGQYQFSEDLSVSATVNNLFDRSYFSSQDELVPLAAGRAVSLSAVYNW